MIASIADRRRADLPIAAVVSAVFFWSFGPLIVRGSTVSSMTFTFWRLWLAVPVMWIAAYALGGEISWSIFRRALVPGLFFGGSMMTSFVAFRETSIANATLIPSLTPAVVLVVAPLAARRTADATSTRVGCARLPRGVDRRPRCRLERLGVDAR